MVVNRKTTVVPVVPAISRSASTQPVPSKKNVREKEKEKERKEKEKEKGKGKATNGSSLGSEIKKSPKHKLSHRKKSRSLLDLILLSVLLLFTSYSLFTCTPNPLFPQSPSSNPPSPLCRSLATYNDHILQPYILPPLKSTLAFTESVARPYIVSAQLKLDPYTAPAAYHLSRVFSVLNGAYKFSVEVYKETLEPYYKHTIAPRYRIYVHPYVHPLSKRISRLFAFYITNPFSRALRRTHINIHRLLHRTVSPLYKSYIYLVVQPRVSQALSTSQSAFKSSSSFYFRSMHPNVLKLYMYIRPHAIQTWKLGMQVFCDVFGFIVRLARVGMDELGVQRKMYVDPHLRKIWDKVNGIDKQESAMPPSETESAFEPEPKEEKNLFIPTDVPSPTLSQTQTQMTSESILEESRSLEQVHHATEVADQSAHQHGPSGVVEALEKEVEAVLEEHQHHNSPTSSPVSSPEPTEVTEVGLEEEFSASPVPMLEEEPEEMAAPTSTSIAESEPSTSQVHQEESGTLAGLGVGASVLEEDEETVVLEEGKAAEPVPSFEPEPDQPANSENFDAEDLDAFLLDLGVGPSSSSSAATPPPPEPSTTVIQVPQQQQQRESEETMQKLIAEKRHSIVTRHAKWFDDLWAAVKRAEGAVPAKEDKKTEETRLQTEKGKEGLRKRIVRIREDAAEELIKIGGVIVTSGKGKGGEDDGEETIRALQKTGEKLLHGVEMFLGKAEARKGQWKVSSLKRDSDPKSEEDEVKQNKAQQELNTFNTVLDKVSARFNERVEKMQVAVYDWYVEVRRVEGHEIHSTSAEIKKIAERAQADIGLDYAWLEDVTVKDWQRYHDLVRVWEMFDERVRGWLGDPPAPKSAEELERANALLASYKPPSPPEDALMNGLDKLQVELDEILAGFGVGLDAMRRKGVELFDIYEEERGKKEKEGEEEEGEVHILPIEPTTKPSPEERETTEGEFDASSILVGKDPVQIEQALKDVPLEKDAHVHEEL